MTGVVADAVVVAAGRSERMGGADKLAADVGGRPLLAWTLHGLAASPIVDRIVLVVARDAASKPRPAWLPEKVIAVVGGGARRQDSVRLGIAAIAAIPAGDEDRVVLIHDGARPIVDPALIERVAAAAHTHGAAIPVVPVAETLKRIDGDRVAATVDRRSVVRAQTPQGVRVDVLRRVMASLPEVGDTELTDDAAVWEAAGESVHVVDGDPANIKVTQPSDLDLVRAHLASPEVLRTGFGSDGHAFGPGDGLRLGGIEIPGAPRLFGHSDGDAALHAIAGALLGAAALGDLGGLHPADARTPRGIASTDILRGVRGNLADAGWTPRSVDLTIRAARPWIQASMPAMREAIANLLGIAVDAVSVKAATGNLSGDAGAGRTIEAQAVATIGRPGSDR
jgi:2-C-methyl-D-erythritol 4-phosphate cytidylyltransferase/2-C-methyl-D-erythritol 2,4-cyclodiphosphate synthase